MLSIVGELLLVIILTRKLGPDGYGTYAYIYAICRILSIPAQAGFPTLVVREVAAYESNLQWSLLKGLLIRVNQFATVISLAVIGMSYVVYVLWFQHAKILERPAVYLALLLVPMIALGNIRGATLRGFGFVLQGQMPESLFRPAFFLGLLVIGPAITPILIGVTEAMTMHLASAMLAFIIGTWMLSKRIPESVREAAPTYETKRWLHSTIPLTFIMGTMAVNAQIATLVLGRYYPAVEVGVFSVAAQIALVMSIPLTVVNIVIAPHISRLYALRDIKKLRLISKTSAKVLLITTLLMVMFIFLRGTWAIGYLFGSNFHPVYDPLVILAVGQCFCVLSGVSMIVLNMTGKERLVLRSYVAGLLINISLSFIIIPKYGVIGAALSSSASMIFLNLFLIYSFIGIFKFSPLPISIGKRNDKCF